MNDSYIEATQALDFGDNNDDVNDDELDNENKPVAFLNIPCQKGFAGKKYPVFQGDNVIGRSEECKICIPLKGLSREHACIEVRGADHFIYDKGSRNRTRRNKHFLAASVRYELKNNDHLLFGDVEADYELITQTTDDDGDETNSESNFDCTPCQKELVNQGIGDVKALENPVKDTAQEEDYQSDASSDILEPTQPFIGNNKQSLSKTKIQNAESAFAQNLTVEDTPESARSRFFLESTVALVTDSPDDNDDDVQTALIGAPTQAYVCESDVSTDDKEEVVPKRALFTMATQAYYDDSTSSYCDESPYKRALLAAPTQAYVADSDDDMDDENDDIKGKNLLYEPTQVCVDDDLDDLEVNTTHAGLLFEPTQAYGDVTTEKAEHTTINETSEQFVLEGGTDAEDTNEDSIDFPSPSVPSTKDANAIKVKKTVAASELTHVVSEVQKPVSNDSTHDLDHITIDNKKCSELDKAKSMDVQERTEKSDVTYDNVTQVFDKEFDGTVEVNVKTSTKKTEVLAEDATKIYEDKMEPKTQPVKHQHDSVNDLFETKIIHDNATQVMEESPVNNKISKARMVSAHDNIENSDSGEAAKLMVNDAAMAMQVFDGTHIDEGTVMGQNFNKKSAMKVSKDDNLEAFCEGDVEIFDITASSTLAVSTTEEDVDEDRRDACGIDATQVKAEIDTARQESHGVGATMKVTDDETVAVVSDHQGQSERIISRQMGIGSDNKSAIITQNATQVFDETLPIKAETDETCIRRNNELNDKQMHVFNETVPVEEILEELSKTNKAFSSKQADETVTEDATQIFDETVAIEEDSVLSNQKQLQTSIVVKKKVEEKIVPYSKQRSQCFAETVPVVEEDDLEVSKCKRNPIRKGRGTRKIKEKDDINSSKQTTLEFDQVASNTSENKQKSDAVAKKGKCIKLDNNQKVENEVAGEALQKSLEEILVEDEVKDGNNLLNIDDINVKTAEQTSSIENETDGIKNDNLVVKVTGRSVRNKSRKGTASKEEIAANSTSKTSAKNEIELRLQNSNRSARRGGKTKQKELYGCGTLSEDDSNTKNIDIIDISAAENNAAVRRNTSRRTKAMKQEVNGQSCKINIEKEDNAVDILRTTSSEKLIENLNETEIELEPATQIWYAECTQEAATQEAATQEAATQEAATQEAATQEAATQRYGYGEDDDATPELMQAEDEIHQELPVIIPVKSPLKSALASPKKEKPSPKRVQFIAQNPQTNSQSSNMSTRPRRGKTVDTLDKIKQEPSKGAETIQKGRGRKRMSDILTGNEMETATKEDGEKIHFTRHSLGKMSISNNESKQLKQSCKDAAEIGTKEKRSTDNEMKTIQDKQKKTTKDSIMIAGTHSEESLKNVKRKSEISDSRSNIKITGDEQVKQVSKVKIEPEVEKANGDYVEHSDNNVCSVKDELNAEKVDTSKSIDETKEKPKIRRSIAFKAKEDIKKEHNRRKSKKQAEQHMNTDDKKEHDNLNVTTRKSVEKTIESEESIQDNSNSRYRTCRKTSDLMEIKTGTSKKQNLETETINQIKSVDSKAISTLKLREHSSKKDQHINDCVDKLDENHGKEIEEKSCVKGTRSKRIGANKTELQDVNVSSKETYLDLNKVQPKQPVSKISSRTKRKESASNSNELQENEVDEKTPAKRQKTQLAATDSLNSSNEKQFGDNVPNSPSLRKTTLEGNKAKVMFTGLVDEQAEKIVKELGGEMVSSVLNCTHLVTDQIRRTVKFLCCLSRGIPIVFPQWLVCSKNSGLFTDPAPFLIQDCASEKKFKFNLRLSLDKANKKRLLEGYRIHVTNSVKPEPAQMKDILQSAGAQYLLTIPKSDAPNTLIISCLEDKELCEASVKAGIPVLNTEFILTGLLRQEININALFSDGIGNKRESNIIDSTDTKHRKR